MSNCARQLVLSAAALFLAGAACVGCAREVRSPGIILICIDTLRADALGVYDDTRRTSPRLDSLAEESAVFENAYTVASWTKPSVPSLLTGLYPSEHGVLETTKTQVDRLPEHFVTLAESLRDAGYRTAAFVENVHLQRRYSGLDQGFDTYQDEAGDAPEIVARFFDWLDDGPDQRFFAYLHLLDPHWPYTPRLPDAPRTLADSLRERVLHWDLRGPRWWLVRDASRDGRLALDPADISALRTLYDMEVGEVDAELGRMLELLAARGILDQTLLIVTADHGEGFYEHRRLDHGYGPYEELVRVPLMMRFPDGRYGGTKVRAPVQITSVAPTVRQYFGLKPPVSVQRSALALLDGTRPDADEDLLFEERHGDTSIVALRSGGYKYIRTLHPPAGRARVEMPGDFTSGARVQVEGVQVSGAFIGADVKLLSPGDTDCEIVAPLMPASSGRERFRILESNLEIDPANTRMIGATQRATPISLSPFAWVRAHGAQARSGFAASKIEQLPVGSVQKLEIEGVVDGIEIDAAGTARVRMCSRRIELSRKVTWREFALAPTVREPKYSRGRDPETQIEELYDLVADPHERINLAARRSEEVERMRERLARLRQSLQVSNDPATRIDIDTNTRRRLEAMGYVD